MTLPQQIKDLVPRSENGAASEREERTSRGGSSRSYTTARQRWRTKAANDNINYNRNVQVTTMLAVRGYINVHNI